MKTAGKHILHGHKDFKLWYRELWLWSHYLHCHGINVMNDVEISECAMQIIFG